MTVSVTVEAEALVVDGDVAEDTSEEVDVTTETEIVSVSVAVEVEVEVLVVDADVGEDASEEDEEEDMMGIVSVTVEVVPNADDDDDADSLVGDVELAELI